MPNLLAFISYVAISTFTPGPNNIMSMSNASHHGFVKSIRFNLGAFFGFIIVMGFCTMFGTTLYLILPTLKSYLLVIGAAYILWLAWKIYKSEAGHLADKSSANSFRSGLLLQFVNLKVILYGMTAITTFIVPYYHSIPVLAGFAVLLAFVGFVSTSCWALFGTVFQKVLKRKHKLINAIMSLLLVYCAVSLFI